MDGAGLDDRNINVLAQKIHFRTQSSAGGGHGELGHRVGHQERSGTYEDYRSSGLFDHAFNELRQLKCQENVHLERPADTIDIHFRPVNRNLLWLRY